MCPIKRNAALWRKKVANGGVSIRSEEGERKDGARKGKVRKKCLRGG